MSTVDPLAALTANSAADAGKQPTQLGQNEFLKLMLAQLKNQDPFKPQDPTAFLGQLAQFSTVTGIQNMQGLLTDLTDSLRSSQVLNGSTLVGHDILAPGDTTAFTTGSTVQGAAEIPDGAIAVEVGVRDATGQLVRRFSIPAQAGLSDFSWDGLTDNGGPAPTGTYQFQIVANVGGEGESLDPLLASRVASVSIDNNGLVLNTGLGAVKIADVRRVM